MSFPRLTCFESAGREVLGFLPKKNCAGFTAIYIMAHFRFLSPVVAISAIFRLFCVFNLLFSDVRCPDTTIDLSKVALLTIAITLKFNLTRFYQREHRLCGFLLEAHIWIENVLDDFWDEKEIKDFKMSFLKCIPFTNDDANFIFQAWNQSIFLHSNIRQKNVCSPIRAGKGLIYSHRQLMFRMTSLAANSLLLCVRVLF